MTGCTSSNCDGFRSQEDSLKAREHVLHVGPHLIPVAEDLAFGVFCFLFDYFCAHGFMSTHQKDNFDLGSFYAF